MEPLVLLNTQTSGKKRTQPTATWTGADSKMSTRENGLLMADWNQNNMHPFRAIGAFILVWFFTFFYYGVEIDNDKWQNELALVCLLPAFGAFLFAL